MADGDQSAGRPVVAVLAGGAGRRFDDVSGKLHAVVDGVPLLTRVIAVVRDLDVPAVDVTKPDRALPSFDPAIARIDEPQTPQHPLAGIVAAFDAHPTTDVVIAVPADAPFLAPALLRALINAERPTVCVDRTGAAQPLLARYERSHRDRLAAAAAAGTPARRVVAQLGLRALRVADYEGDERSLVNINTPEDLARVAGQAAPDVFHPRDV